MAQMCCTVKCKTLDQNPSDYFVDGIAAPMKMHCKKYSNINILLSAYAEILP